MLESVANAFAAKFKAKVATMAVGDPREGRTPLGAVVDIKAVGHVGGLIRDAIGQGAQLVNGGDADGVLMPAHVVDRVTPAMKLFRDESFGPVDAVVRAANEHHAIELANDTEYGLSAAGDSLERLSGVLDFELFRPVLAVALARSDRSRGG